MYVEHVGSTDNGLWLRNFEKDQLRGTESQEEHGTRDATRRVRVKVTLVTYPRLWVRTSYCVLSVVLSKNGTREDIDSGIDEHQKA